MSCFSSLGGGCSIEIMCRKEVTAGISAAGRTPSAPIHGNCLLISNDSLKLNIMQFFKCVYPENGLGQLAGH